MKTVMSFFLTMVLVTNLTITSFSQQDQKKEIENFTWRKTEGIILKKGYKMPPAYDTISRFTPTNEEIIEAERILKENIKDLNKQRMNQFGNYPVIHNHLNCYFRQYVGIINEKGEKIVHINLLWYRYSQAYLKKRYTDPRMGYSDEYVIVNDGGSFYWRVNVNLKLKKLFDLSINGIA